MGDPRGQGLERRKGGELLVPGTNLFAAPSLGIEGIDRRCHERLQYEGEVKLMVDERYLAEERVALSGTGGRSLADLLREHFATEEDPLASVALGRLRISVERC